MNHAIHTFDNGIKVFDHHLLASQRTRYQQTNVHEPDEEPIFLRTIDALPEGGRFVNIGTAIGYYVILAKMRRPDLHVACFEPLPLHLDYMRENIKLNGLDPVDFGIEGVAISNQRGSIEFIQHRFGSAVADRPPIANLKIRLSQWIGRLTGQADPESGERITVPAITLLDAMDRFDGPVDFVQMDIQRHEAQVLATYFEELADRPSPMRRLLVGTHGRSLHRDCSKLLTDGRFRLTHDEFATKHQPDGILLAEYAE
jgi:FkbM family methyltransferase